MVSQGTSQVVVDLGTRSSCVCVNPAE